MPAVPNNGQPTEEKKAQKEMEGVPKGSRQRCNLLRFYSAHIWTAEKEESGKETPCRSDLLTIVGD